MNRYRTLEDFAESLISDPSQRERLYFPTEIEADDRPRQSHGPLARIVLVAPVILAVVLMVVLARLRWGI